jgi:hypothetical protein
VCVMDFIMTRSENATPPGGPNSDTMALEALSWSPDVLVLYKHFAEWEKNWIRSLLPHGVGRLVCECGEGIPTDCR